MRYCGLLLAAVLPSGVAFPSEVSSEFTLSEGRIAFKAPEEQTGNNGFSWVERDYYGDYYYYYDIFDDYRGSGEYFDYYYGQLTSATSRRQEELIGGGRTNFGFECHGNAKLDALFIDPVFVDTRRLEISVAYYYATWWNTAQEWWEDDYYFFHEYYYYYGDDAPGKDGSAVDVWLKSVTTADVSDSLEKMPANGQWRAPSILMKVQPIDHVGQMHAEGAQVETGLAFEYECFGTGQTLVQVTLAVQSAKHSREDICVNWIKQCSMTLPFLALEDDYLEDTMVDNVVLADAPLFTQPVTDMYSFFYLRLMQPGTVRMRVPDIYAKWAKGVGVDFRLEDMENTFMDVSQTRTRITVDYTCFKEGVFAVQMLLQRDWSSYTEIVEVQWKKKCGGDDTKFSETPAVDFEVTLNSETYGNKTPTVSHGTVLPGFKRPCPRSGISRTRHEDDEDEVTEYRPPPKTCVDEVPKLLVPKSDRTTTLHWEWDSAEDPQIEDTVIGYNPRLMEAKITNDWKHHKSEVAYVCFQDGTGNVTVTVYARGRAPMDFAWRKDCTQPTSPHLGKDVTTGIAFAALAVLCAFCGNCGIGVCCCVRKYRGYHRASAVEVEVASIVGNEVTVGKGQEDVLSD